MQYIQLICDVLLTIVGVSTIVVSLVTYRQQQRQLFFECYTDRYQRIIEHLPDWVFTGKIKSYEELKKDGAVSYLRAYYDLCSEEFFLHTKNRISDEVWKEWEEGILSSFSYPAFRVFWDASVKNGIVDSYGEFVDYINRSLKIKTK